MSIYNPLAKKIQKEVAQAFVKKIEYTYSDFIKDENGFQDIPMFFKEHLYLPSYKEKRDRSLEELYLKLKPIIGPKLIQKIRLLIELILLTDTLDFELALILLEPRSKYFHGKKNLDSSVGGDSNTINIEMEHELSYREIIWAFRKAGERHRKAREEQIEMICETLMFFFSLSKLPVASLLITPIKVAGFMVGADELTLTIEAGYKIFRKIEHLEHFIEAFRLRERKNIDKIFSIV